MQPYPGTNGGAIVYSSTPGAGGISGGVLTIVQDASHGLFSVPQVVTGNDQVTTGNVAPAPQANRDAVVWIGWRTPDWINGGDYHTAFTGTVKMGGILVYEGGSAAILVGGGGLLGIGGALIGIATLEVTNGSTFQLDSGSVANSSAITTSGFNITSAVLTSATAATFTGDGTGSGVKATPGASQVAAVWAHNGAVFVDKATGSPATGPTPNTLWANNIPKAEGSIVVSAGPAVAASSGSFNVQSVSLTDPGGGHFGSITVQLATAMASADYVVLMAPIVDGSGNFWIPAAHPVDSSHFKFVLPTAIGASTLANIDTILTTHMFAVFGLQ